VSWFGRILQTRRLKVRRESTSKSGSVTDDGSRRIEMRVESYRTRNNKILFMMNG